MSDYMVEASNYVIENARYVGDTPSEQCYQVRFPLHSAHLIRSADTHDLTVKVAAAMERRANA